MSDRFGKIGLWSADYTEIHGQALVTRRVAEHILPRFAYHREYIYRPGGGVRAIASWIGATVRLWRDVALGRLDSLYLVCSRSTAGFLRDVPALALTLVGTRMVVHVHGSDLKALLSERAVSPLARYLYRRAELIVPSNHMVSPLADHTFEDLTVCENFVNHSQIGARQAEPGLSVCWNSNIMASKGVFDFLEAVKRLNDQGHHVRAEMAGAVLGDDVMTTVEAKKRFSAMEHEPWLTWHGRVDNSEIAKLLARCDAVALLSRVEAQGIAIMEAMCAGKAVLASDIAAFRATLGDYPAEFVCTGSIDAVADALKRFSNERTTNPTGFSSRYADPAARARERFSVERFDDEMLSILDRSDHAKGAMRSRSSDDLFD